GDNLIGGLFDVQQAKSGVVQNVITVADNYADQLEVYNGFDLNITARLPNGALLSGGTNTERMSRNTCYTLNDASLVTASAQGVTTPAGTPRSSAYCDTQPPFLTQVKRSGAYPLPRCKMQVNATAP